MHVRGMISMDHVIGVLVMKILLAREGFKTAESKNVINQGLKNKRCWNVLKYMERILKSSN